MCGLEDANFRIRMYEAQFARRNTIRLCTAALLQQFSSGYWVTQAFISDNVLSNSNTHCEELLREFSGTTLPERTALVARARLCSCLSNAFFSKSHVRMHESTSNSRGKRQTYMMYYCNSTAVQGINQTSTLSKSA